MNQPQWTLSSELLADYRIFRVLQKRGRSPRTGQTVVYHALEMADWVQIIPRAPSGELIMVEQFRPGADISSLEFPAGLIDEGEKPMVAGIRELEEETGYRAATAHLVGSIFPNPAIQSNRLHILYADACDPGGVINQDAGEDVNVRLVTEEQLPSLIHAGEINHALVLTAWQLYQLWRAGPVTS
jgi:8-oxo-dGTP pyrophosphatase MutT (NUDIX family)